MSLYGRWVTTVGTEGGQCSSRIPLKRRSDLPTCIASVQQRKNSKLAQGVTRRRKQEIFNPRFKTPFLSKVYQVDQSQQTELQLQQQVPGTNSEQSSLRESEGQQQSPVCEFLKGKTLFVTGATGFLAKVLVEKILFEQPDVKKIYLLIQRRGKMSAQDRLKEQVLSSQAFNRIREQKGEQFQEFMLSKLTAVQGDLSAPLMGMDESTVQMLQRDIEIAVNSAATTTFDERYDFAIKLNTLGAKEMTRFAAGCDNLKLLVHVSTAFVNGMREGVGPETPFDLNHAIIQELNNQSQQEEMPKLDIEEEIRFALSAYDMCKQKMSSRNGKSEEEQEQEVVEKLKELGMQQAQKYGWQDTYVFTKAMGEMLVGIETAKAGIPTVILRPSIVESAYREPIEGWMEGIRMADPIIIAFGKGQMPGFAADKDGVLDIIPVDFVINALIATMYKHACVPGLTVYQSATSTANPNVVSRFAQLVSEHFKETPMLDKNGPIQVSDMVVYGSQELFLFDVWKQYKLPYQIQQVRSQFLMWMQAGNDDPQTNMNRKRQLIAEKTQEQFSYLAKIYTPYTFYKCRFSVARMQELFNELCEEDQDKFNFDIASLDWADYVKRVHIPGLRKFVLKGR
eukprot:TRINITY_DN2219_c0_g1_i1.p2 TRINITY_DN2219_c0_g1~~TRINITY_DN2219_c0_g1_i1.p2  ORF type:complete len:623 (-),score=75.53 TRINITY_DN2219_c0_g1_i1:650-2518(-)